MKGIRIMRKLLLAAVFMASAAALPALAQTNSANNDSANGNTGTTAAASHATTSPAQIEQDLRQDLSKAGYTNIKIMPGSFLVHAKDSKGNPTEMMVSPNSVTEVTAMNAAGNSAQNGSANGQIGSGQNNAGTAQNGASASKK